MSPLFYSCKWERPQFSFRSVNTCSVETEVSLDEDRLNEVSTSIMECDDRLNKLWGDLITKVCYCVLFGK